MSLELKNKLIVLVANEPWGEIWYSKHNYAYELSKNNTIIFIDPAPGWKIFNAFVDPELKNISGNLFTIHYYNYFPLLNKTISVWNNILCSSKLKGAITNYFKRPIDVFWSFDPHRLFDPALFSPGHSIFHVVDKYDFRFFGEKFLVKNSDLIVVVSKLFEEQYKGIGKKTVYVPHGIANSQFVSDKEVTLNYEGIYVGNIDERLDFVLLERILKQFPAIQFLFIGKFYCENDKIAKGIFIDKKYPNMNWIGVKPFNELKNYISRAKFCLSIMDLRYPGNDIAHHKTLQYLAFGKPIFGSIFKDYSEISGLIYQSNSPEELISLMRKFLAEGELNDLKTQRIAFAKQFSYDHHIISIQKALNA
jgi:hypothetical protein